MAVLATINRIVWAVLFVIAAIAVVVKFTNLMGVLIAVIVLISGMLVVSRL